jgi:hypothetical protein
MSRRAKTKARKDAGNSDIGNIGVTEDVASRRFAAAESCVISGMEH